MGVLLHFLVPKDFNPQPNTIRPSDFWSAVQFCPGLKNFIQGSKTQIIKKFRWEVRSGDVSSQSAQATHELAQSNGSIAPADASLAAPCTQAIFDRHLLSAADGLQVRLKDGSALGCSVCEESSTESCPGCSEPHCARHLYACDECIVQLCSSCLSAHEAEGHWDDSRTATEMVSAWSPQKTSQLSRQCQLVQESGCRASRSCPLQHFDEV